MVEDNQAVADGVERGLLAEGYAVDVVGDGLDGLWRAREFAYDAIVLDIMLPGMNGYEVCRTLRSEQIVTPILMLSAKDGDYDVAEGLDLGADDYLAKPFSFVVLVARIRALLRRADGRPGTDAVTVGPLVIDTISRTCQVGGTDVEFTAREYALIEVLARRAGEPLTRVELIDNVWGADHDTASNVVDVYVGYVRKKLQAADPAGESLIQTVRGVGYRLVAT